MSSILKNFIHFRIKDYRNIVDVRALLSCIVIMHCTLVMQEQFESLKSQAVSSGIGWREQGERKPNRRNVLNIWCYLPCVHTFEAEAEIISEFRKNL